MSQKNTLDRYAYRPVSGQYDGRYGAIRFQRYHSAGAGLRAMNDRYDTRYDPTVRISPSLYRREGDTGAVRSGVRQGAERGV